MKQKNYEAETLLTLKENIFNLLKNESIQLQEKLQILTTTVTTEITNITVLNQDISDSRILIQTLLDDQIIQQQQLVNFEEEYEENRILVDRINFADADQEAFEMVRIGK